MDGESRSECYERMSQETGSSILARLYRKQAEALKHAADDMEDRNVG